MMSRRSPGYDAIVLNFTNHAGVFGPSGRSTHRRPPERARPRQRVVAFHAALSSIPSGLNMRN